MISGQTTGPELLAAGDGCIFQIISQQIFLVVLKNVGLGKRQS
jgi:hypothetical protein